MDRLVALFEQLPVPEVARLLRRTALSSLCVGVAAMIATVLLGRPLIGLGGCIGLGLGLLNIRLIVRSVTQLTEAAAPSPKRILALRSLARLGATTIVVIGLMFASADLGLSAFAGLALFYFVLVANIARALLSPPAPGVHV